MVLGLDNSCSYLGVAIGGVVGVFGINFVDAHMVVGTATVRYGPAP